MSRKLKLILGYLLGATTTKQSNPIQSKMSKVKKNQFICCGEVQKRNWCYVCHADDNCEYCSGEVCYACGEVRDDGYSASVEIKQAEDYANCIIVEWDYENKKLNKLMEKEYRNEVGDKKKNLLWLNKVKEVANWKVGETIYINQKNFAGCFEAYWSKDKNSCLNDIIIEPTGYVCMKTCNLYTMTWEADTDERIKNLFYIRVESKYNDLQTKMM